MPVNRFVLENWVPKKLNANIDVPANYDFKELMAPKLDDNKLLKDGQ